MPKIIIPGRHNQRSLNQCNVIPPLKGNENIDLPPSMCGNDAPSQKSVGSTRPSVGWLEDASMKKIGIGQSQQCDPMQRGILNDLQTPNRDYIYRYSQAQRGCDEAMKDLFSDMIVFDDNGKAWPVPIIWASPENAVASIVQDNISQGNDLTVSRIKLPMLAIYSASYAPSQRRYIYHKAINYQRGLREDNKPGFTVDEKYERDTVLGIAPGKPVDIGYILNIWTGYKEDLNQIMEQVELKFSPTASLNVRGVPWEILVKYDSASPNLDVEPGDQKLRVIKCQFNFTAETYIPQPIVRKKAVLNMKLDFYNSVDEEKITDVIDRVEVSNDD